MADSIPTEEDVWQALHAVDTVQTLYAARHPDHFREVNPLLGAHPSTSTVLVWSVGTAALHYAILRQLQRHGVNPRGFERVTIGLTGTGVVFNMAMGVRP